MTISKFWTRIWALLLDSLVLGVFGAIIGFSFNDFFVQIGQNGMLIGLIITLVYFTISNSYILKGQTLGKRALDIIVVNKEGEYLSLSQSLLRALILCLGYFLVNFKIPGIDPDSFFSTTLSLIFFAISLCIIVFYIFNKANRQSIHDIIIGSYVISKERNEDESIIPKPTKLAYYISGGLFILLCSSSFSGLNNNPELQKLNLTNTELKQIDGVINAGFSSNTHTIYSDETTTTTSYNATLWVIDLPHDQSKIEKLDIVKKSLNIIFANEEKAKDCDYINITLARGFNIGIAKSNRTFNISKSPSDWKDLIE